MNKVKILFVFIVLAAVGGAVFWRQKQNQMAPDGGGAIEVPVEMPVQVTEKIDTGATTLSHSQVIKNASSEIAVGKTKAETKKTKNGYADVKWEDLYKLDYKTGEAPEYVKKLHNTKIRMPGFIVPLSDDLSSLQEFLLVPNAQACIHVPPPPPNLIVHVFLKQPIPIEKVSNPSWIEGTLKIETSESEYGASSYKMEGESLEEYKF